MTWQEFRRIILETRKDYLGMNQTQFANFLSSDTPLKLDKSAISRIENAGGRTGIRQFDERVLPTLRLIAPHTRKKDGTNYSVEELIEIAFRSSATAGEETTELKATETTELLVDKICQFINCELSKFPVTEVANALSVSRLVVLNKNRKTSENKRSHSNVCLLNNEINRGDISVQLSPSQRYKLSILLRASLNEMGFPDRPGGAAKHLGYTDFNLPILIELMLGEKRSLEIGDREMSIIAALCRRVKWDENFPILQGGTYAGNVGDLINAIDCNICNGKSA